MAGFLAAAGVRVGGLNLWGGRMTPEASMLLAKCLRPATGREADFLPRADLKARLARCFHTDECVKFLAENVEVLIG